MLDLVIRNGSVVLADATVEMDVGVLGGKVSCLEQPGRPMDAREEIDASGLYVFPDFIDAHVHVNMPLGEFVPTTGSPTRPGPRPTVARRSWTSPYRIPESLP